jgi:hypothetical protein
MTTPQFGMPAPSTRPASCSRDRASRSTRTAWILARAVHHEPVEYEAYARRFGASLGAYRQDVAALKRARIYRGGELLGSDLR